METVSIDVVRGLRDGAVGGFAFVLVLFLFGTSNAGYDTQVHEYLLPGILATWLLLGAFIKNSLLLDSAAYAIFFGVNSVLWGVPIMGVSIFARLVLRFVGVFRSKATGG